MSLTLMYITNSPEIAKVAEDSGVNWIFIDLEILGKEDRQGHLDTVISRHSVADIHPIKAILETSKVLVRINPINEDSSVEIEEVINNGADIIMLPFFSTTEEVELFIKMVDGRVETCLLLETEGALKNLKSISMLEGINFVHIGLNDLHLQLGRKFMFELLVDGTIDDACLTFQERGIEFGIGGIARLGQGLIPAEDIIVEHYRRGSSMAILSRSFCDSKNYDSTEKFSSEIKKEMIKLREFEKYASEMSDEDFKDNFEQLRAKIL